MSIAYLFGPAPAPDSSAAQDRFVMRGRELRPGIALQSTSRFSNEVWDLTPGQFKQHERKLTLNFTPVPERFRPAVKQLLDALLSAPLPAGEERCELLLVRAVFTSLKAFLIWLDGRWAGYRTHLGELSADDLEGFMRHQAATMPDKPPRRAMIRSHVRYLWRWREHLGQDGLRFDPLRIEGWGGRRDRRRRENATERIPEPVLGAMLAWALRFIDEFAPDILHALQVRDQLLAPVDRADPTRPGAGAQFVRGALAAHVAANRPLPGREGRLNQLHFARALGIGRIVVRNPQLQPDFDAAIAKVGLTETTHYDLEISGLLDGRAWIPFIETEPGAFYGVGRLARLLQAAAYVTIAFLSGMRDGEIKHLRRGGLHIQRDSEGNGCRWKLLSLAFKGEADTTHGVPAAWTVGEPVARAVAVLERLVEPDQEYLFAALHIGAARTGGAGEALTTAATNLHLRDFAHWVNEYCDRNNRLDAVPAVDGHEFVVTTRQFRRTLAWFIARRPGGVIAGAVQYRHHSIAMFEGYAGTSDSGFRAEVEAERAMARGEVYMEMIDAHEHTDLQGPSAQEAATRLADFAEQAQYQGKIALDKNRLLRIMKRNDPAIYPGEYITCVHNAATALCEKAKRSREEHLPDHGGCLPLACRNVALTIGNVQAWRREFDRIETRLAARPPLPPLQHARLAGRRDEIAEFLARATAPLETAP